MTPNFYLSKKMNSYKMSAKWQRMRKVLRVFPLHVFDSESLWWLEEWRWRFWATNNVGLHLMIRNSKTIFGRQLHWMHGSMEFWPRTIINIPIDNATWWPVPVCYMLHDLFRQKSIRTFDAAAAATNIRSQFRYFKPQIIFLVGTRWGEVLHKTLRKVQNERKGGVYNR